jgi:hypothetical protein
MRPRVAGHVVGDERPAFGDHAAEQRVEVPELHAIRAALLVEPPRLLVPCDVRDRVRAQEPARLVLVDRADEAVLAPGEADEQGERALPPLRPGAGVLDVGPLQLGEFLVEPSLEADAFLAGRLGGDVARGEAARPARAADGGGEEPVGAVPRAQAQGWRRIRVPPGARASSIARRPAASSG